MRLKAVFLLALGSVLLFAPAAFSQAGDGQFALSREGDAVAGQRAFAVCRACHNLTADQQPRVGPNLDNIFGRPAASSESFPRYSQALKASGIVWSEQNLDEWLAKPRTFLPGNKMTFPGIGDEQKRKDLIAYLREATVSAN